MEGNSQTSTINSISVSFMQAELARRGEARRAALISHDLQERDALVVPLGLALARLAAQRDARRQGEAAHV